MRYAQRGYTPGEQRRREQVRLQAACLLRFPGVLLSRWPLRACCHRRGSAAAAHSRATDPATTRAEPAAILGLRCCTARGTRRTETQVIRASLAIASTVNRRGLRRPDRTPGTIPTTEKARLIRAYRDRWRAVGGAAVAGTSMPRSRNR